MKINRLTRDKKFILFSLLFLPVFFSPYTFEVFELPKIYLFRFFTLAILSAFILKEKTTAKKKISLKLKGLIFLWLAFGLVQIITTIISPFRWTSFWGSYFRQMGLLTYLYYGLFFFLLGINFSSIKEQKLLFCCLVLGSVIPVFYGLLQVLRLDPVIWEDFNFRGRIFSTFGQPNFFASYLLFLLPLTFFFFLQSKSDEDKKRRYFLFFLLFLQILCLFFTGSRGGWLGFIGEILLFVFIFSSLSRKFKISLFLLASFIVVGMILLTFYPLPYDLLGFYYRKPTGRKLIAKASWEAIKERPWLGYGLDTQGYAISVYLEPEILQYEDINIPDRAHNIILDTLLCSGMLGAFFYLMLWLSFLREFIRRIKKDRQNNSLDNYIAIALCGYFIQNFFHFDTSISFLFWGVFLVCFFVYEEKKEVSLLKREKRKESLLKNIFFMGLLLLIGYFSLKPLIGDFYYQKGMEQDRKDLLQAQISFKKAITFSPYENLYKLTFVNNITKELKAQAKTGKEYDKKAKEDALIRARRLLYQVEEKEQTNYFYHYTKADFLVARAFFENKPDFFKEALSQVDLAIAKAPARLEALLLKINLLEVLGRQEEAKENMAYFLAIAPPKFHNRQILEQFKRLQ